MRFPMRALTALLVAAPLSAQTPAAGPRATLSLEEAQDLAARNNPAYLQTENNQTVAAANVRNAYGSLVPEVSASMGGGYRQGKQQFLGGQAFGSTADQLSSSYAINANAQYSVGSFVAPRQQRANADAVDGDIRNARMTLRTDVARQYLNALAEEARAALQDTLLRTAEVQLELANVRQQVGSATILDVQQARVQVGQQRVAIIRARALAATEKQRLFQLLGVPASSTVELTTRFPVEQPDLELTQLLDMARAENPALGSARLRERAADVGVIAARGEYAPTLSFNANWGGYTNQLTDDQSLLAGQLGQKQGPCYQAEEIKAIVGQPSNPAACAAIALTPQEISAVKAGNKAFPFDFTTNPYELSVRLTLPIYNGFAREQRVQEASAARSDARYEVRAAELRVNTEVNIGFLSLQAAYEAHRIQQENVATARQALELAQERYRVGASTFVEVSTARDDYERAVQEEIDAAYAYHRSYAALEAAVGRPLR
ncbi:MAG TPA: TolC family protein [Gemmatimonadaceae bacterium]|nr:TolC family protein [Gemmatimonadaceae bacterium]